MSITRRLNELGNRFYDAIRSGKADDAATRAPTGSIDDLRKSKYCVLVTYRRNGDPIPSPLWFGVHDGRLYFRTPADAMKVKRLRNNPEVRVAPSTMRGRLKAAPFVGGARVMEASEEADAERWIQANYSAGRRLYEGALGGSTDGAYVEVTPSAS